MTPVFEVMAVKDKLPLLRSQPHGAAARFPIGIVFTISLGNRFYDARAQRERWHGVGSIPATSAAFPPRPSKPTY